MCSSGHGRGSALRSRMEPIATSLPFGGSDVPHFQRLRGREESFPASHRWKSTEGTWKDHVYKGGPLSDAWQQQRPQIIDYMIGVLLYDNANVVGYIIHNEVMDSEKGKSLLLSVSAVVCFLKFWYPAYVGLHNPYSHFLHHTLLWKLTAVTSVGVSETSFNGAWCHSR